MNPLRLRLGLVLVAAVAVLVVGCASGTVLPETCAPGSVSAGLPFCDVSLPRKTRVQDLMSRLDLPTKLGYFLMASSSPPYVEDLNLKALLWNSNMVHGLACSGTGPYHINVTVFPHVIALGATFDLDLIASVAHVTVLEGRIADQLIYAGSNGTSHACIQSTGGPLANTAHVPTWGRISETYGEDRLLVGQMAATMTRELQNRTEGEEYFLQSSQVTRHWLGYHFSNLLPHGGVESMDYQWLADQYLPAYRPTQVDAQAEGIMCSMNTMNFNGTGPIPPCLNPFLLQHILRQEWNSSAFVQTDCCDSITSAVQQHHYRNYTMAEAVAAAIHAGTQNVFTKPGNVAPVLAGVTSAVESGLVSEADLDSAVSRMFDVRFKLGEFDSENPANPFRHPVPESLLDSPAHRLLARQTAAASTVLLRNHGDLLPLSSAHDLNLAVVGPFADCWWPSGDWHATPLGSCTYLHSYTGSASSVNTILAALKSQAKTTTSAALLQPVTAGNVSSAVAAAKSADVTVVVVGLGYLVERECFDRTSLTLPPDQRALVSALADAVPSNKLIIIVVSGGPVVLDDPTVADAVLWSPYGGEETGGGVSDIMFGAAVPSARLPVTQYTEEYLSHIGPESDFNLISNGTGRTYRFVDDKFVAYRFGFGLSYARFGYSGLSVKGSASTGLTVSVEVENKGWSSGKSAETLSGVEAAKEIVQVYVTGPAQDVVTAKHTLVAFSAVVLPTNDAKTLSLDVPADRLATAFPDGSTRVVPGTYTVFVSGQQPDDPNAVSNVVSMKIAL